MFGFKEVLKKNTKEMIFFIVGFIMKNSDENKI